MTICIFARNNNHQNNITGDDSVYTVRWDHIMKAIGITYDPVTGNFRVPEDGFYQVSWSYYLMNLLNTNLSGAGWVHGSGNSQYPSQEPYTFNGNPWAMRNQGGTTGGGSDCYAIEGSMGFWVEKDAADGGLIRTAVRVAGNPTKNVGIMYDGYFSIIKQG